jgi:hypothetical protein
MVNAHGAGSQPQPADNQASNGEIVPDDDASAESLRHNADVHPASDHEPPAAAVEAGSTAEETAALEAGGERTSAPNERTKIEGPNSA